MDQLETKPIPFMFAESYLFGALFPVSLAYVLTRVILVTPAILDDWFLVIWLMAVAIAYAWVSSKRQISIAALLSGGLAGWISAVAVYQWVVGFGLVDFFVGILLFGSVPIVIGAWLAYEIRRRRGSTF